MKSQKTEYRTYQVCIFAVNGKEKTIKRTETIKAKNISNAAEIASTMFPGETLRTYPLVSASDGQSIMEMAEFSLASYERWETRNNFAVNNPKNRSQFEKEDLVSVATLAIINKLRENPGATMYEVKSTAFSAIASEQKSKERLSEREYLPGWASCNIAPVGPRPTYPALDRMLAYAVDQADITDDQNVILQMYYIERKEVADIMAETGKSRSKVYRSLYRAYCRILDKAYNTEGSGDIFKAAGITKEDVETAIETMRKRGMAK